MLRKIGIWIGVAHLITSDAVLIRLAVANFSGIRIYKMIYYI